MTHIVIHDDTSNVTHYAEFDDVQAAASFLEDLVTRDGESNARLFALQPVEFAVKSYVRVEIGAPASGPAELAGHEVAPTTAAEPVAVENPVEAVADQADQTVDDTVEYVEAAMAPVDSFAPVAPMSEHLDDLSGGEPRRGLFGR
jgi:hypothetical protein